MATVRGYTAERMQEIEDSTVVGGEVNPSGDLILETRDGTTINAGHVKGADATALLGVEDTNSIDLVLTGAGTPASPWLLKANNKFGYPSIASGSNLNTFQTPGQWAIDTVAIARTIENWAGQGIPTATTADANNSAGSFIPALLGTLTVSVSGARVIQEAALLISAVGHIRGVGILRRSLAADGITWSPWIADRDVWPVGSSSGQKFSAQYLRAGTENIIEAARTDFRPPLSLLCMDSAGAMWWRADTRTFQTSPAWATATLLGAWVPYSGTPGPPNFATAQYLRTEAGIVQLRGLVSSGAVGSTIFTLPQGFRPAAQSVFLAQDNGNSAGSYIAVLPNGDVVWRGKAAGGTGWVNLDGVKFPAADVAPNSAWTAYTINTTDGWSVYDPTGDVVNPPASAFPRPAYWQDRYGRVWSRGLAKRALGNPVSTSSIATFPVGLIPNQMIHQAVLSGGTNMYAALHYGDTSSVRNAIVWKPESPAGSTNWINFGDLVIFPVANFPESSWALLSLVAGSAYNTALFPAPSIIRMPDGLIHVRGLLGGVATGVVFTSPMSANDRNPGLLQAFSSLANSSMTRIDYSNTHTLGKLGGNGAWTSLDGISYLVEG